MRTAEQVLNELKDNGIVHTVEQILTDIYQSATLLGNVEFTVGDEAADTRRVTIQLVTPSGNNMAGRALLVVWLSNAAGGGEFSQAGTSLGSTLITGALISASNTTSILTDETGAMALDVVMAGDELTGEPQPAGTCYLNVAYGGRIFSSDAIVFE